MQSIFLLAQDKVPTIGILHFGGYPISDQDFPPAPSFKNMFKKTKNNEINQECFNQLEKSLIE